MNTLFPEANRFPEGFVYRPEFITPEEEEALIRFISKIQLHVFTFQGFEAKRKVASFGFDYSFDKGSLSAGMPIPQEFYPLIQKVANSLSVPASEFAELLITEYPPGSVINWHRDAPPFDLIAGISLLTDCKFRLRPYDKKLQNRNATISFTVERRSLYIMRGLSRTDWQHSIAPVKERRYSITLRTLRR